MTKDIFAHQEMGTSTPSKRVLLVDEEATDLRIMRLTLEGQGFEVFTCTNYDAGVICLDVEQFDFVMVSQGSHAFEGRRVLDRAMQLDRRRPVLVLTRLIDMHCYLEAMQMGAVDYLEKPVPPLDLLRYVQAHITSATLRSHQTAT